MKNTSETAHPFRHSKHEIPVYPAISRGRVGGELDRIRSDAEKIDQRLSKIGILRSDLI
jgi:hypothetical protein